jgi:hypothetical protein
MQHKIRLTADWTDPETREQHRAGDIITVPEYYLRLESSTGLQGKYSVDLAPPVPVAEPPAAQEASPRRTKNAEAFASPAAAPDAPPDNDSD